MRSRNEPSHLNLHCLKKYFLWFPDLKGLTVCKYVKLKPDSNNFNILAICYSRTSITNLFGTRKNLLEVWLIRVTEG